MTTGMTGEVEAFIEKNIALTPPFPARRPEALRARADALREDAQAARMQFSAAGVDVERLDELAKEQAGARHARADKERLRAIQASAAVDAWLSGLTPAPLDPGPTIAVIDQVTFIRSFGVGVVTDSGISSTDNWARYQLQVSADAVDQIGAGRLSFFILWKNPRTRAIIANVDPRVSVNAYLAVNAEWNGVGDWFIGGSEALATVRARTTVWAMWTPSLQGVVSDVILGSAGATGGFFGGDDSISLAVNQLIPGTGFFVPAKESILIEVSLLTEYKLANGSLHLDAGSGDLKVSMPHLIIKMT